MKKFVLYSMILLLCLFLIACGKSAAAKDVDELIMSIGEVTLDSEEAILAAEAALSNLEEEDREQVESEEILTEARSKYSVLFAEKCINDIGEVTEESESTVIYARETYNDLSEEEKTAVSNVAVLDAAEQRLKEVRAEKVVSIINELGTITLESEEKLDDAELAYYALSKEEKDLVSNYSILETAREKYEALRKKEYDAAVSRMIVSTDEINGCSFYDPKAMPKYTNTRCCLLPYIGIRGSHSWMKLRFNYAGREWVFFKEATIAVDDARYDKSFDYFDIKHYAGSVVGE